MGKILFTVVFTALVFALPVLEIESHRGSTGWLSFSVFIGNYALPFLLYLFLAVAVSDCLLLINHVIKILPVDSVHNRKARLFSLGALLLIPIIIVIAGSLHYNSIRVNRYQIKVQKRASSIDHLRIALVADFHLREMTSKAFMPAFVTTINALHPDIILIAGDVVEGDRDDENTLQFEQLFRKVSSKYGIYAVYGNHEHHAGSSAEQFFRNAHIEVVSEKTILIDKAFYIIGRNDTRSDERKPIQELLRSATKDLPVVVIDHRPVDIDRVSHTRVDIQVSGHTHGGQLFPLNYIVKHIYGISWGYKKHGATHFFVTSGIRGWGPQVRTAGDSEIMLIDVDLIPADVKALLENNGCLLVPARQTACNSPAPDENHL